ncbi:unnamed protein product, partial [Mesorhabditis spiculigera]
MLGHLLLYVALQFLSSIAALLFSGPDNAELIPWNKEHGRVSKEQTGKKTKSPAASRANRQHLSPKQVTQQESKYSPVVPSDSGRGRDGNSNPEQPPKQH